MSGKFYLYAPQVHQGGGKILLQGLVKNPPSNIDCYLIIDDRLEKNQLSVDGWEVRTIKSSPLSRLSCERWLSKNVNKGDTILFYSNLPPLFRIGGKVIVFLQNKYLIDGQTLSGFPFLSKLKLAIQRLWFFWRINSAKYVIVQTETMARAFRKKIADSNSLKVCPVMDLKLDHVRSTDHYIEDNMDNSEFLYIASGEPHKNHKRLIEAWCHLSLESVTPKLHVTIDLDVWPEVGKYISKAKNEYGVKVINHGLIPNNRVMELYHHVDALIYPSLLESFGIPLIEARQNNLPIIASELDYVREVVDPEQTFDPKSSISIAKAVKRFLKMRDTTEKIRSSREFLDEIINY